MTMGADEIVPAPGNCALPVISLGFGSSKIAAQRPCGCYKLQVIYKQSTEGFDSADLKGLKRCRPS
jgi:hypothetical protein